MFFCFKQKTAYEMRSSDWSSDVCSSDLVRSPETIASKVDSDETPVRRSRPYLKYMLAWTAGLSFEAGARAGAFSGSLDRPCARARACSGVGKVVPRGSSFSRAPAKD